jgi:hypothetical protein
MIKKIHHKVKSKIQTHRLKRAQRKEEKRQKHYLLHNHPTAFDHAILSWVAPETIKHERGTIWKIGMSIIVIALVIYAIRTGAWTFALAIVTAAVTYWLVHLEHPKEVEIVISDIGIKVGTRKYSFGKIRAFWLIYHPPYVSTLNIKVSDEIVGEITIELGSQNPSHVREVLIEKIPELEGKSESFSDILIRLLKI